MTFKFAIICTFNYLVEFANCENIPFIAFVIFGAIERVRFSYFDFVK